MESRFFGFIDKPMLFAESLVILVELLELGKILPESFGEYPLFSLLYLSFEVVVILPELGFMLEKLVIKLFAG